MRLWDYKGSGAPEIGFPTDVLKLRESVLLFYYRHFNQINTVGARSCFAARISTTFNFC